MKKIAIDLEKIYAKHKSNKGLVSGIQKELSQLNDKKTNSLIFKMVKRFEQALHQLKNTDDKHIKKC